MQRFALFCDSFWIQVWLPGPNNTMPCMWRECGVLRDKMCICNVWKCGGLSRGTDPAALMEGLQEAGLVSWRASRVVLAQALSNRLGKPLAVIPSNAPEYLRGLALISSNAPDSNEKRGVTSPFWHPSNRLLITRQPKDSCSTCIAR